MALSEHTSTNLGVSPFIASMVSYLIHTLSLETAWCMETVFGNAYRRQNTAVSINFLRKSLAEKIVSHERKWIKILIYLA